MNPLAHIPFDKLLWLIPLLVIVHNLEEAPRMETWTRQYIPKWHMTKRQAWFATTLVSLFVLFVTLTVDTKAPQSFGIYVLIGIQSGMLANVLTHVLPSFWFKSATPGTYTALLLNLPFSLYLFQRGFHDGYLTREPFIIAVIAGVVIMAPLAFFFQRIGGLIAKI